MANEMHAEGVSGEETFHLDEKVHRLAETFLETQPVVFRRGGRHC